MFQNLAKIKPVAIAKLKNGEPLESISDDLEISKTLIEEWAGNLTPSEMVAKEVNAIAIQKASRLLSTEKTNDIETLQNTLVELGIAIADELKMDIKDFEIAKAINVSADTVSKLQNAFFAKGTQISVVNNNSNTNVSNDLKMFKGTLRN